MVQWYRRLADVPGVGFEGSPGVDRARLPGHAAVPQIEKTRVNGKRLEMVTWPGRTSASPAQSWQSKSKKGETPAQAALRQMYEALELPGTPSDYHFAIQGCCNQLLDWKTRHNEEWVYAEAEQLCWLDIRLIEAHPEAVSYDQEGKTKYARVIAFATLINLYEQEGYLFEALEVARKAVKFDQQLSSCEELERRIAALEAEYA